MLAQFKLLNQQNANVISSASKKFSNPSMILLSAKSKDILKLQIKRLIEVLKNKEWKEDSLIDIAYTLQVGRISMTERLGVLADSVEDLLHKLESILAGEVDFSGYALIGSNTNLITLEQKQEKNEEAKKCIQLKDYKRLLQLWSSGAEVDWEEIYKDTMLKPKKVALPTYPFHKNNVSKRKKNIMFYTPVWVKSQEKKIDSNIISRRVIVLISPENIMFSQMKSKLTSTECIAINSANQDINLYYEEIVIGLADLFKEKLENNHDTSLFFQIVILSDEYEVTQGIRGFLKTIEEEYQNVCCQMIQLENNIKAHELLEILSENTPFVKQNDIRYQQGGRFVRGLKQINADYRRSDSRSCLPWKQNGVYLITGGAGAIGLLFAHEIIRQNKNIVTILIGRRELSEQQAEIINRWNNDGHSVVYWRVDITEKAQVQQLIQKIIEKYDHLNGIIHSAGIIKDHLLYNKTAEEFVQVLKPKTSGTVYLDSCTSSIDIDFFALFSSGTAETGNIGQADYTAANGFMDSFAEYRNKLVERRERYGKTISINWPFWKNGGMALSKKQIKDMIRENGLRPIETYEGINAFYFAMSSEVNQMLVMTGEEDIIKNNLEKQFTLVEKTEKNNFENTKEKAEDDEAVAIIGLSGRFPMAENIEKFWENVKEAKNCITELPEKRWSMENFFEANKDKAFQSGKSYCKWGGFLEGFDEFDPAFFNIPPVEAKQIDPQERLFLQECWKAVEDAGYAPSNMDNELKKKIGVYGAITKTGFMLWNSDEYKGYYTSFASFVNRVSYFMDFGGPSVAVDTMCSSSLVAVYEAYKSLLKGEINLAVVGGCNLYLHPFNFQYLSQMRMLGDKPQSSVFEKGGIGFTPSEGCGAMVLKRLSDAKRDKDAIWAVIRGGAVKHSGKTNGYSVPNPGKIADVIIDALNNSKVLPETIRHIETASNGSEMTDSMEIEAINRVFCMLNKDLVNENYYTLGSVKSILGHGEAVSGFAQLLKAILQLKNKKICPLKMPNNPTEQIDFDRLPYKAVQEYKYFTESFFQGKTIPRRIGINGIGAGGVYAHIILEEYVKEREVFNSNNDDKKKLFLFSAKSDESLHEYMDKWKQYLVENPNVDLNTLSYILQVKREAMKKRIAIIATTRDELIECITDFKNNVKNPNLFIEEPNSCTTRQSRNLSDQKIIELINNQEITELAELWIKNNRIPWNCFYQNCQIPEHIAMLPLYPFKKKSFWVKKNDEKISESFISLEEMYEKKEAEGSIINQTDAVKNVGIDIAEIIKIIKNLLSEILFLDDTDELDEYTSFMELGIDSIYTKMFIKQFNEETGLNLRETEIFNYSNIIEFAKYADRIMKIRG